MDQRTVGRLEEEIEEAIAVIMLRRSKDWQVPLLPSQRAMHLMAKAAVAVYEGVVEAQQGQKEGRHEHRAEP